MPLNIIRSDITKVKADAIVNTANPEVAIGYGVDQAIYEAAGEEQLLAERAKIGPMLPGQAAATPAFALDAKYIIHTIGPAWEGGGYGEREAVASCYRESLRIADELQCESIAFPLISTGTLGFPKDEALRIAISEISNFLFNHDMMVHMVVYDKKAFVISTKAFGDVKSYIDEQDVKPSAAEYYSNSTVVERRRNRRHRLSIPWKSAKTSDYSDLQESLEGTAMLETEAMPESDVTPVPDATPESDDFVMLEPDEMTSPLPVGESASLGSSLDDLLNQDSETFQQRLFRIIDRKGLKDPEVYKKANIDRKLFSKIRSNEHYVPSKRTALAFAVALELNLDETADLLQRAGLALSPSSRFDLIVGYCINHKIYDIIEINTYLFDYDEPLLVG